MIVLNLSPKLYSQCGLSCRNSTVQITQKFVCRQIQNLAFFVFPWPTSWTLVDVLDVLCRYSKATSNLQILDIFYFPRNPLLPTQRVPKEGLALRLSLLQCGLKSFKLYQKHEMFYADIMSLSRCYAYF